MTRKPERPRLLDAPLAGRNKEVHGRTAKTLRPNARDRPISSFRPLVAGWTSATGHRIEDLGDTGQAMPKNESRQLAEFFRNQGPPAAEAMENLRPGTMAPVVLAELDRHLRGAWPKARHLRRVSRSDGAERGRMRVLACDNADKGHHHHAGGGHEGRAGGGRGFGRTGGDAGPLQPGCSEQEQAAGEAADGQHAPGTSRTLGAGAWGDGALACGAFASAVALDACAHEARAPAGLARRAGPGRCGRARR